MMSYCIVLLRGNKERVDIDLISLKIDCDLVQN